MGKKAAGKYYREKEQRTGFWCSLPVCVIMTILFLPLGLILVFSRLYKKRMIKKSTKNIAVAVNMVIVVLFTAIVATDSPQGASEERRETEGSIGTAEEIGGIELSQYMGLTLVECESAMNVDFQGGGNNIYPLCIFVWKCSKPAFGYGGGIFHRRNAPSRICFSAVCRIRTSQII